MAIVQVNIPLMQELVAALDRAIAAGPKGDLDGVLNALNDAIAALESGAMQGGHSEQMLANMTEMRNGLAKELHIVAMVADDVMATEPGWSDLDAAAALWEETRNDPGASEPPPQ